MSNGDQNVQIEAKMVNLDFDEVSDGTQKSGRNAQKSVVLAILMKPPINF